MKSKVNIVHPAQNFTGFLKDQFVKSRAALAAFYFIIVLILLAIFADFIANDKPIVAKIEGHWYFPVIKQYTTGLGTSVGPNGNIHYEWKNKSYDFVIWPVIPYLPGTLDKKMANVSPFGPQAVRSAWQRHWLGTDPVGRDVLAGMIHGTRVAFSVGIISMGLAAFIGVLLGALAGFFGDNRLRITIIRLILNLVFIVLGIFYGFCVRSFILDDAISESFFLFFYEFLISTVIFALLIFIGNVIVIPFEKISFLKTNINIPVDIIISRFIEIVVTIPKLFLIISLLAIAKPSIFIVMAVIGLTSWTGIARLIRAEMLRIRTMGYIEAAKALGYSSVRTIIKHALPNGLRPVIIAISFGMAAAILIESTLSFLGLGVAPDVVTWGTILSKARISWWLALFPGIAIFLTITTFNLVGEGLSDALDPKMKK